MNPLKEDRMRRGLAAAIAIAALGCRYRAEVVPIWGDTGDLDRMAGEWTGGYFSPESHRSGTIAFRITAHGDSAFGEVLMGIPLEENDLSLVDLERGHSGRAHSADTLSVQFVRVAGGGVRGELEAYTAPDCECRVRTIFTGTIEGNVVSGSFLTTTEWGGTQAGSWRMVRVKPPARRRGAVVGKAAPR
jgi:hypothetical protein